MRYNLLLYAVDGKQFGAEFQDGESLLSRVMQKIRDEKAYTPNGLKFVEEILHAGILDQAWPDDETTDPFEALSWILETIAEPMHFDQFSEFKHFVILEDTGLLRRFDINDATIPLPRGTGTHALATVLANHKMANVLEEELQRPNPVDPHARILRTLFLDALESLQPDGLDLYMIVQ